MKFTLLNLKTLLLFSGIIIGFANPINADNYNSNDTDSTKYDDSWSSTKTNKDKSGFENKNEDKPCYGPNCKNKKKYFQDDYDVKHNKYKSDFDLNNKKEEKQCIGKDCYNNKNVLVPCVDSECESSRVESNYNDMRSKEDYDSPRYKPARFFQSIFSSSYSSVTDSNGTRVAQKQYGMCDNGNTKYEEKELSKGNSQSGVVKTKYNNNTFDRKSNRKFSGDDKFFEEKFNDFVDGKPDTRHMSYNKFVKNAAKFNKNNLLPSDNKRIESNTKQLPDSNYYNKYNNKDNLDRNIYKTLYNMNTLPEEDIE